MQNPGHSICNQGVGGSNPSAGTTTNQALSAYLSPPIFAPVFGVVVLLVLFFAQRCKPGEQGLMVGAC